MKRYEVMFELILEAIILALQIILCLYFIPKTLGFLWPFVTGWVIALITWPITQLVQKKFHINRRIISVITLILLIGLVAGGVFCILISLGKEALNLMTDLPSLFNSFISVIEKLPVMISNLNFIPKSMQINVDSLLESIKAAAFSIVNEIGSIGVSHAAELAKNVTNFFVGFIVSILSAYFFIIYKEKMATGYKNFLPKDFQNRLKHITDSVKDAIGGYFLAQLKLMAIIFVILLVGLFITGNPYSLLLAFLIALLDVIPFFGTGFVLIPWALYDVVAGNYYLALLRVILYVCCLLGRQLLQPKIIGDSVGLDPFITLVLIYIGFKVNGIAGFLIAMIAGILVRNFYKMGLFDQKIHRIKHLLIRLNEANEKI